MAFFVYLLRCGDGTLYTGTAADPFLREDVHNSGRGAKYTRARLPVTLLYAEPCADRPAALRRELMIKRLPRAEKFALLRTRDKAGIDYVQPDAAALADEYARAAAACLTPEERAACPAFPAPSCSAPTLTLADRRGRTAGFALMDPACDSVYKAYTVHIHALAIAPPWRGSGLAAELLLHALPPCPDGADGRIDASGLLSTPCGRRFAARLGVPPPTGDAPAVAAYPAFFARLTALTPQHDTETEAPV